MSHRLLDLLLFIPLLVDVDELELDELEEDPEDPPEPPEPPEPPDPPPPPFLPDECPVECLLKLLAETPTPV